MPTWLLVALLVFLALYGTARVTGKSFNIPLIGPKGG